MKLAILATIAVAFLLLPLAATLSPQPRVHDSDFKLKLIASNTACNDKVAEISHIGAAINAVVGVEPFLGLPGAVFAFNGTQMRSIVVNGSVIPYTLGFAPKLSVPFQPLLVSVDYDAKGWYFDKIGTLKLAKEPDLRFYSCPRVFLDGYSVVNAVFVKHFDKDTPANCTDIMLGRIAA